MTIRSSLYFTFAGERSIDYGIINVNIDSGMQEESFVSERAILETETRGRDKPYFQEIKRRPLQFTLSFAFEDKWDNEKIRSVARWLTNHEYYQPLSFSENNERIFYAIVIDDPQLIHNCLSEGYINLTVRCDSPYSYSPQFISNIYDWNEIPEIVSENSFSLGEIKNLITDVNGDLILDPVKSKWIDLSPTLTWNET